MDQRTIRLTQAPLTSTLVRLAIPNALVMVAQTSIGLIETYFIAKLGLDALAGVALVFPLLMLLQMIAGGAMGGGILSAVARALGAGRRERAHDIVWHAVAITLALGAVATAAALLFAPKLYSLMGGVDGSLAAAITYSSIIFAGTIPLWLYNTFAAVIRGTGNMLVPASVTLGGACILIPFSPLLIFGIGPFPRLGVAGGATAVVLYYTCGCVLLGWYIWTGRGPLKPPVKPPNLSWGPAWDILRVGAASSIVSLSTNVSIATATGLAGMLGPAAAAGYGTGARLEYVMIPVIFGLGAPTAAMVGTCIGAGLRQRAKQAAWTGAILAAAIAETIGLLAAFFPKGWLSLFGDDSTMLDIGSTYLRTVGPFYGFFGAGLALYFAAQGTGRIVWPMWAAVLRVPRRCERRRARRLQRSSASRECLRTHSSRMSPTACNRPLWWAGDAESDDERSSRPRLSGISPNSRSYFCRSKRLAARSRADKNAERSRAENGRGPAVI